MAISRGEIYFVNLSPGQGREQAGTRPVVVLSIDAINQLPLVVTVAVGTKTATHFTSKSTILHTAPARIGT